jgi:hypothetical protein
MSTPEYEGEVRLLHDRICFRLGITEDECASLFTACPVDGAVGTVVAEQIRAKFGLTDGQEDLADALEGRGILTAREAAYLADEDVQDWQEILADVADEDVPEEIRWKLTPRDFQAHNDGEMTPNVLALWIYLCDRFPGCELRLWGDNRTVELDR